ncbi:hypothetical protein MCEMRE22_00459 [Candidatus Nanopelagicaceae bacterium]
MALVRIEKVESWSVYKIFEAETLEIALEMAKSYKSAVPFTLTPEASWREIEKELDKIISI